MRYSLVSREVIADSIETGVRRARMDGLLAIGGCDKNMPGAMIAIARLDIPAIFVYGGRSSRSLRRAGSHGGECVRSGGGSRGGAHAADELLEIDVAPVRRRLVARHVHGKHDAAAIEAMA